MFWFIYLHNLLENKLICDYCIFYIPGGLNSKRFQSFNSRKMINEFVRRTNGEQYSPKSSPRGSRSPLVNSRQDTTGTLKTTISLGKTPTIVHSGPFYLMKEVGGK